jgi:hypothetical protein
LEQQKGPVEAQRYAKFAFRCGFSLLRINQRVKTRRISVHGVVLEWARRGTRLLVEIPAASLIVATSTRALLPASKLPGGKAAARAVATVSDFLTVGFSDALNPSRNHTSSIWMGHAVTVALSKAKLL